MLSHVSVGVADLARSIAFYDGVFAPLGYVRLWSTERGAGWGSPGVDDEPFAIHEAGASVRAAGAGCHLAFIAPSTVAVDRFHAAALQLGGADEGAPGLRPHYGPTYYAAFVRDPDGNKLEAVRH